MNNTKYKGFKLINKKFRICKIVNLFADKRVNNSQNYKHMNLYVMVTHTKNKFIKLICEIRLVLNTIRDLHDQRNILKPYFKELITDKEIKIIELEIAKGKKVKSIKTPTESSDKKLFKQ